jgi:hypothetical protein
MSTTYDEAMIEKECQGQRITKPKVAINFNETMGGVDLSDASLFSYQGARKRPNKYYQKHFQDIEIVKRDHSKLPPTRINIPHYPSFISPIEKKTQRSY